jgi:hypothetical protein
MAWSTSEGRRAFLQVHCTAGAFRGSMLRPRRWRRPLRTSPLLSSRAQVRVSSQAEAGRQAGTAEKACASAPAVHAGGVVRREERVETVFGRAPGEDSLGPGDVAEALGVHLLPLWLPEVAPFAVEGLPLRPERIAAGSLEGPEHLRALAHGNVGGGGGCEVRSAAKRRTGAGEAEAAVAKGEGDLLSHGAVCGGPTHDGEGAVDRLALRPLDGWADLRPMAAARQVCHPALEAAVEQQPPVLVR